MKNNNLETYEKLRTVPKEAQKQFNNGKFSGTDINPMWRIKKMTEVFGMCGIGWYVEVVNREMIKADNGEQSAFVSVNLYIKDEKSGEWSKPIYGEGGTIKDSNMVFMFPRISIPAIAKTKIAPSVLW